METTTIEISVENWQWLSSLKQRPSETFDDVVDRLREQHEEVTQPTSELKSGAESVPEDIDLPGSGETFEQRREALEELYQYLQREGTATRSDFLELVAPDDVAYASAESFWSNAVKGRDSLSALNGVVPPSEGGHTWRFEPDD